MDAYRVHLTRAGLESFASSLIWTAMMVYQVEVVGLTPLQLVLVGTTMEATVFLFEIPTGIVADVYSRRLSVIIGYVLIGVAYLVQGALPVFAAILLAQVVWGIGYTFTSGAYDAWMVDELGQKQAGNAFLRGAQVSRILAIAGIGVSVVLGSINLQIPIITGGLLTVLVSGFLLLFMPENGFTPTPAAERNTWQDMVNTFRKGVGLVRGRPALMSIMAIGLFYGLYSEGWDRLWQAHLLRNVGFPVIAGLQPVAWFGAIRIIDMVLAVPAAEVVRRKVDMNQAAAMTRALLVLTFLMIVGLVGYGLSYSLVLALVAFFLFSTARGLVMPIFSTWTNQHVDSRVRATVLSLQSQTDAIGQIVGGPPVGAIGQLSLRAAFFASATILSPVLVLLRRTRKTAVSQAVETLEA